MSEKQSRVQQVTIAEEFEGQRIDNFLLRLLKGVPRSLIYRIIRKGEVRVNKGRIKPVYKLKAGDVVRIPPVKTSDATSSVVPSDAVCQKIKSRIIYEDDKLLILNKPSGLAAHGGEGLPYGAIEVMRVLYGDGVDLVHRLDRATSGCLLFTRDRRCLASLHEMFKDKLMLKQYQALLMGRWRGGERSVTAAIAQRREETGNRSIFVSRDGKSANTLFSPVAVFERASLMDVTLGTGRMHQIRVHAAHIDHPVAGDERYGDFAFNRSMRKLGLKRMFLHAAMLDFVLPWSGKRVSVRAPLGDKLEAVLDRLAKSDGQGKVDSEGV